MRASPAYNYADKFAHIAPQTLFSKLPTGTRAFIEGQAAVLRLTQQELRIVCEIANDLEMFKEGDIQAIWPNEVSHKKQLMAALQSGYQRMLDKPKNYANFTPADKPRAQKPNLVSVSKKALGLGYCPVASEKTRCCNLLTLDAVERCGFDCSYCSIQSFYHQNEVRFDTDFAEKLAQIQLDPEKTYHIGTGQSSDSLMWGNHNGNLDALAEFAGKNPNVILELKTKSRNINWLLENDYPENIICTWSLNPQVVIDFEEHQTASLAERIQAARKIADKGRLVGFHFHPMIWYDQFEQDYADIAQTLRDQFSVEEVVLVSMGTLTYTKEVMRTIRRRAFKSKILQMPFVEVAGKYAYPEEIKISMFRHLFEQLSGWHRNVFFYLCMEPESLWQPVFGDAGYTSNTEFEQAMKSTYMQKIDAVRTASDGSNLTGQIQ